jgi:hypothetical protein
LVELGDDLKTPWGFTVKGFNEEMTPVYGYYRFWASLDDFLGINNKKN